MTTPIAVRFCPAPVRSRETSAFTLVELLATGVVLSILASLMLPALSNFKTRSNSIVCVNNLKQLQTSYLLYTADQHDELPLNASYFDGRNWRSTSNSWIGNSSAPKDRDFKPIEQGLLYKYDYNRSLAIYHCPSDRSKVDGTDMARTRSFSVQAHLGGGGTNDLRRLAAIQQPGPSQVFVFLDEEESSIDDGHFLVWNVPDTRWVNMPSDRHGQGATLSFADGHAEIWKWGWRKDFKNKRDYFKETETESDLQDLRRLQAACPQSENGSPIQ